MTPEEIKQLTPDGYGGDFEMTVQQPENLSSMYQVEVQVEVQDGDDR